MLKRAPTIGRRWTTVKVNRKRLMAELSVLTGILPRSAGRLAAGTTGTAMGAPGSAPARSHGWREVGTG